jgi:hypothetical protein
MTLTVTAMAIDKQLVEVLTAKVASMTSDQRWARLTEIADSGERSNQAMLEAVKLFFSPDATLSDE